MPLRDFLSPDETIKFRSPTMIDYQGDDYNFYITNRRLIWHRQKGLIFRKDNFVCEMLDNVNAISYKEEGLIIKNATIKVNIGNRQLPFTGSRDSMRAIYNEMQALIPPMLKQRFVVSAAD